MDSIVVLIDTVEASKLTGVKQAIIRKHAKRGTLRAAMLGGSYLFRDVDLKWWLAQYKLGLLDGRKISDKRGGKKCK